MKKFISLVVFLTIIFAGVGSSLAATHTVNKGDTYWKIGIQYGVPVKTLMSVNNAKNSTLSIGQKLAIPASSVTSSEKDLLARLVEAEAKGEPYAGKVAVATVVLNRVDSSLFPNTVNGVVYQSSQFTPVSNGQINKAASADSMKAVNEALAFRGQGSGSLYFYNPAKTTNTWLRSKATTIKIGNHVFAK
ncbi:cell wall hydrolase [Robertmurraya sp. DFI.2.37]|uniref:cell wall hydrolase n=1 Tax=Robertmurraya sp. DFI.2.37 TaxID=3031819 RepID=UPI001245ACF1|nr:cell wall hydrolase [Robertmurraya sp. DFI.2.37]MDF1510504.1 cell wall hydrolase [Robertmurraya sp. DFI.2.37]